MVEVCSFNNNATIIKKEKVQLFMDISTVTEKQIRIYIYILILLQFVQLFVTERFEQQHYKSK